MTAKLLLSDFVCTEFHQEPNEPKKNMKMTGYTNICTRFQYPCVMV